MVFVDGHGEVDGAHDARAKLLFDQFLEGSAVDVDDFLRRFQNVQETDQREARGLRIIEMPNLGLLGSRPRADNSQAHWLAGFELNIH